MNDKYYTFVVSLLDGKFFKWHSVYGLEKGERDLRVRYNGRWRHCNIYKKGTKEFVKQIRP